MSGEPKPLTLTLKEALAEARERNWKVTFGPSFTVKIHDETGFELAFGWGWEGPFAAALGVRVVARDEAAELRAAVREYFAAYDDFEQREAAVPREERSRMNDRINAAWDELRRLAGGENEK